MKNIKSSIKKYLSQKKNQKKVITIGLMVIVAVLAVVIIPKTFAQQEAIKSVTIDSENLKYLLNEDGGKIGDPGSWRIEKSAKWIDYGKARITFKVNTYLDYDDVDGDVILALDTSGSMRGNRIERLRTEASLLAFNYVEGTDREMAIIEFNDDSKILTGFTDDVKKLQDISKNLTEGGETNYYAALANVDQLLKNYVPKEGKGVLVIFITDGYPSVDTPNEVNMYRVLMEKYPYLTINALQYEMGDSITPALKNISEYQVAIDGNSLSFSLYGSMMKIIHYTKFNIKDYIDTDYFKSIDAVSANAGIAKITDENREVSWNLDGFPSSQSATMTIDVTLKDEYLGVDGFFPTNTGEEIVSSIRRGDEDVKSDLTPVLQSAYPVIYDGNAPAGCTVTNVPTTEKHMVFETVGISDTIPKCDGYQFKGWDIITSGVSKVNDDYFTMPEQNVTIRAKWSKAKIVKTMDGDVYTEKTLYSMIAKQGKDNIYEETYDYHSWYLQPGEVGVYEYDASKDDEYPVYFYRGPVTNNNLIFADICWKIVRTTETGGVKLLYNGKPSNGVCKNTGTASEVRKIEYNGMRDVDTGKVNNAFFGYWTGLYELPFSNSNQSLIVNDAVNSWFKSSINSSKYLKQQLEDAVWCNDRRIKSGGNWAIQDTEYQPMDRVVWADYIDLSCEVNDSYTVNPDTEDNASDHVPLANGNKKLTYPVGLLTADELLMAGLGKDSYLNTGEDFWTMSPYQLKSEYGYMVASVNGSWYEISMMNLLGFRPAVSLKHETIVNIGDGSEDNPYVVE